MELTPAQKIIAKDRHRFRVVRAGRRFGKTYLALEEIKGKAIKKSCRIGYFATTYQQARDICWELLKKELAPAIIQINESRLEIRTKTLQGGESLIQLRGWESVETARGQHFDFLVIDEIASMKNFWSAWEEILSPTLLDTKGEVLFISTPKGFNHFYELCNEELENKDFKSFHFTSYDNPFLDKSEIDKEKQTKGPEAFEQEYMASFQKTQGLVYKEFLRSLHLYQELPSITGLKKVAGIDFGYTNPAAVLDIRTNGDKFLVENEWYKKERTDIQIAEYVAQNHFEAVYPDPESPGAIEELIRARVNVREVVKGKDSIENGIKKVKELLLSGRLKINARCINLISEFEMYSYDDEDGEINAKEKPIKANDHALDALRYVVSMMQPAIKKYIDPIWEVKDEKNPAI
jgi:PBSX family phage terminase large subunit